MAVQIIDATERHWRLMRDARLRALADSPDAFGSTLAREQGFDRAEWASRASASGPTLIAVEDGVPVAMGGVYVPAGTTDAQVWGMWTDPDHRGRGLAVDILNRLVAWSASQGFSLRLHVTVGNVAARTLYERHGFTATGAAPEELRTGSGLWVEELSLTGPA